jgi:cytochrome P450
MLVFYVDIFKQFLLKYYRLNVDDGDIFKPERFISPTDSTTKAFMPFGKGPYMCIGNKFAQLEIKTDIKVLIQSSRLALVLDQRPVNFSVFI